MSAQKPKRGRPPKAARERRDDQLCVSLTGGERAMLEREAKRRGLTVSELLMAPWRRGRR